MSLCLRPVKEVWGESMIYSQRETGIDNVIEAICDYAEEQRGLKSEAITYETSQYGDMTVIYISNGHAFLDYLEAASVDVIMDRLANDDHTSSDDAEYIRQRDDVEALKIMARTWRSSIDTDDGAIRLYCD